MLVLVAVLVAGSLAVLFAGSAVVPHGVRSTTSTTSHSGSPAPNGDPERDPLTWPFTRDSIWNLPIGADAVYVPAHIQKATAAGMTADVDVLILTPSAPDTPVYYNGDAWDKVPGRCDVQGGVLFNAPIPTDFVVPGNGGGNPHGTTPNYATAILAADGHTLYQGQPFARCSAGGNATIMWSQDSEDLYGTGFSGAHGGSMLSSIGGTIRLGELVSGGAIRHAMKLNMDSVNFYNGSGGYRWPATTADSGYKDFYTGSIPEVRMGSLLALPKATDVDNMGLETEPAKILARAFQDYGAYIADTAGWSVYGIDTEYSPSGDVLVEFQDDWGFPLWEDSKDTPWARDMDRIFGNLSVVDNWDATTWLTVSASNGALGVGLGLPRVAWAPDLGPIPPDIIPPVSIDTMTGTPGLGGWYVSPVTVKVKARDIGGSGVNVTHVRTDGGTWEDYTAPIVISGDGSHSFESYATDFAGNNETIHSVRFTIDTVPPVSTARVDGALAPGGYLSPVILTLTATDATSGVGSIHYRIDDGALWTYSTPFRIAGAGNHRLDYFATDQAGNEEVLHTLLIPVSGYGGAHPPPIVVFDASGTAGANGWYVSTVDVSLTPSSSNGSTPSIAYRVDDGPWVEYSGSFQVPQGRHLISYQASDSDGFLGPVQSIPLDIDFTPPKVVKAAAIGDVVGPDATVSWTGTDHESGLAGYQVSVDGGPYLPMGRATVLPESWSIGSHVVTVRAWDVAGNEGTQTIAFRVETDGGSSAAGLVSARAPSVPGSLSLALGFLMVSISVLLLNRRSMERGLRPWIRRVEIRTRRRLSRVCSRRSR